MKIFFRLPILLIIVAMTGNCTSKLPDSNAEPLSLPRSEVETVSASSSASQSQPAKALTAEEVNSIAKNITVLIKADGENGSGVIIAKDGNVYYVLTAKHVVKGHGNLTIVTSDGRQHPNTNVKESLGLDLAVLQFTSDRDYQVATLADYTPETGSYVFVSGWPGSEREEEPNRLFSAGVLFNKDFAFWISKDPLQKGYELLYGNITYRGMSGGPVLDISGRVIGIHGNSEGEGDSELVLGYGMGIPIRTFLKFTTQLGLSVTSSSDLPAFPGIQEIASITSFLNLEKPKNSGDAIASFKYGIQLFRLAKLQEAVTAFDTATNLNPKLQQAWYVRGRALGGLGQFEQAIESYDKAIAIQPNFLEAWRLKCVTISYRKRDEEAIDCYKQAIDIEPDFVLYHFLGEALQALKRYPEAIDAYTDALNDQQNATTYSNRGVSYYELGNFQAAVEDFNRSLQNDPAIDDQMRAYVNRGNTRVKMGSLQSALEDYTAALNLAPNLSNLPGIASDINIANVYYDRGFVREQLGDFQGAFADYSEVLRINPNDAQAYSSRGNVRAAQGDFQAAIKDWNQALKINPEYPDAYNNRGYAYSLQKEWSKAMEDYNQAIRFNPKFAIAYHNRGNAYKALGDRQRAIEDFRMAAQLYQDQGNRDGYEEVQKLIIELQQ
jgi:tetratricopeptide (TPR) repeat protein